MKMDQKIAQYLIVCVYNVCECVCGVHVHGCVYTPVICDVVATGTTLHHGGLAIVHSD